MMATASDETIRPFEVLKIELPTAYDFEIAALAAKFLAKAIDNLAIVNHHDLASQGLENGKVSSFRCMSTQRSQHPQLETGQTWMEMICRLAGHMGLADRLG